MYFDDSTQPLDAGVAGDLRVILYGSAAVTVLFVLFISPVYDAAETAARSLVGV